MINNYDEMWMWMIDSLLIGGSASRVALGSCPGVRRLFERRRQQFGLMWSN